MDFLLHGALTYVIGDILGLPAMCSGISAGVATVPDVVGYLEKKIKKNDDIWSWYKTFHDTRAWYLYVVPMIALHILIDYAWHDHTTGKWKSWTYVADAFFWSLIVLYFTLKYF